MGEKRTARPCLWRAAIAILAWAVAGHGPAASARPRDGADTLPAYSCFGAPDSCLTQLSRTRDRELYDLCLMARNVCAPFMQKPGFTERALAPFTHHWEGPPVSDVKTRR